MKLTGTKVLVKRLESDSSIISTEKENRVEIIEIGDGEQWQPMEVKPGDKAIIKPKTGSDITIGDEKYLLIKQDDIMYWE